MQCPQDIRAQMKDLNQEETNRFVLGMLQKLMSDSDDAART